MYPPPSSPSPIHLEHLRRQRMAEAPDDLDRAFALVMIQVGWTEIGERHRRGVSLRHVAGEEQDAGIDIMSEQTYRESS